MVWAGQKISSSSRKGLDFSGADFEEWYLVASGFDKAEFSLKSGDIPYTKCESMFYPETQPIFHEDNKKATFKLLCFP